MCGRFVIKSTWAEYYEWLGIVPPSEKGRNTAANYNVAPTDEVAFLTSGKSGVTATVGSWWLVPWWAKEKPKFAAFNARSETAHSSGAFKDAFKSKRCLVPADAYYEWTKNADDGGKDPWCITLPNWEPFAFAGLWAHNTRLDVTSFTIITAPASAAIEDIHGRMPVILKNDAFEAWLDPATGVDEARELLNRNRGGELSGFRVGRQVNSSRYEGADAIQPV